MWQRLHVPLRLLLLSLILTLLSGCRTNSPFFTSRIKGLAPSDDRLHVARELYRVGAYDDALLECVELSQKDPDIPGLEELRLQVLRAAMEKRAEALAAQAELSDRHLAGEALAGSLIPESYGAVREIEELPYDSLSPDSPMRKILENPVTLNLRGANLAALIEALSADPNINMIADHGIGQTEQIDVEINDVPLHELLKYVERNMGVRFYIGERVLWVTAAEEGGQAPMETRVFRLRHGLQMHGNEWEHVAQKEQSAISRLTHQATVMPTNQTYIEAVIEKLVPRQDGSVLHLDRNTHTLFVRDTTDNLEAISRIVEALDISPPQVLIEARFIEVMVGDLHDLGIRWMLDSPWVISRNFKVEEGEVDYSSDQATFIGADMQRERKKTGSFGLFETPSLTGQGLSLGLQGVIEDTKFKAFLHALDISGKGRTLSMPRVTTINNNPAKLRSGSDLRYFEQFQAQAFNLVDANNARYTITVLIPTGAPSVEELGITLLAVPSVGADRRTISLLLNPSISELEEFVSYQEERKGEEISKDVTKDDIQQVVAKLPKFNRREVATKLTVQSGETVVMGGLIDTVAQSTEHKVPLLGDLPIIGALFRSTNITEQRRNLLIFVTATVISDTGESLVVNPITER